MSSTRRRGWLNALVRSWFPARRAPVRRRRSTRLQIEPLEDRLTPNAYLVNVSGDSSGRSTGTGSSDGNPLHGDLRFVLNKAIQDQQTDTITFAASLTGQTI